MQCFCRFQRASTQTTFELQLGSVLCLVDLQINRHKRQILAAKVERAAAMPFQQQCSISNSSTFKLCLRACLPSQQHGKPLPIQPAPPFKATAPFQHRWSGSYTSSMTLRATGRLALQVQPCTAA